MANTANNILKYGILLIFIACILYVICTTVTVKEGFEEDNKDTDNKMETSPSATYANYGEDDTLILSKKNAGNIEYLKERVSDTNKYGSSIDELQNNVKLMQEQIDALVQQQTDFAKDIAGSEPIDVSGT